VTICYTPQKSVKDNYIPEPKPLSFFPNKFFEYVISSVHPRLALLSNSWFWPQCCIKASTRTKATIDSTIGTALGSTQGSCLPLPLKVVSSPNKNNCLGECPKL